MPLTIIRQDITKMNVDAIVNATNTDLQFNGGSNNSPLNSSHRAPHDNASLGAPHYVSSHGDLSDNPTPNHIHTSTTPNPTTPTSVSAAIFRAAGPPEIQAKLQEACDKLAPIQTGEAVLTPAFNLPAKYIIHVAGPNYHDWTPDQAAALLRTSYENALALAANHAINTIAFPLISTGSYGFPKTLALQIATTTIKDFLITHEMEVSLILFDKSSLDASQAVYGAIDQYITQHYVDTQTIRRFSRIAPDLGPKPPQHPKRKPTRGTSFDSTHDTTQEAALERLSEVIEAHELSTVEQFEIQTDGEPHTFGEPNTYGEPQTLSAPMPAVGKTRSTAPPTTTTTPTPTTTTPQTPTLDTTLENLDEPFTALLFRIIDHKNLTDVEVYKRANLTRQHFSKIRSTPNYMPSKRTVLALALALELSAAETNHLLARAGYALSHAVKFDVIIEYFITHQIYDVLQINEILFHYDQPLLGA